MIPRTVFRAVAISVGLSLAGCGTTAATTQEHRFEVSFRVTTDAGDSLAGATVVSGSRTLGVTDPLGALEVALDGLEGQTHPITLTCPEGFAAPENIAPLRLTRSRRVSAGPGDAAAISFPAVCTRQVRDVVLVVHVEHGEALPVLVDGKAVGVTDSDGVAHVLLHFDRSVRSFGVGLDTSSRHELRPRNPSRAFDLAGRDAVVLFDQALTAAPRIVVKQAAPVRRVPYRIN
jgi:hypothetical protein